MGYFFILKLPGTIPDIPVLSIRIIRHQHLFFNSTSTEHLEAWSRWGPDEHKTNRLLNVGSPYGHKRPEDNRPNITRFQTLVTRIFGQGAPATRSFFGAMSP